MLMFDTRQYVKYTRNGIFDSGVRCYIFWNVIACLNDIRRRVLRPYLIIHRNNFFESFTSDIMISDLNVIFYTGSVKCD